MYRSILTFLFICVSTFIIAQNTSARKFTNIYPAFSNKGNQIAFTSDRDGNSEIYIMNVDGTNQVRITDHPAKDNFPEWSPDDKKIAFVSNRDTTSSDIYIIDLKTKETKRLTIGMKLATPKLSWSPDGKWISFSCRKTGFENPYIVSTDKDAIIKQLITDTFRTYHCSWLPDSRNIIFHSDRSGKKNELRLHQIDIQTGVIKKLLTTETAFDDYLPEVSANGKKVVFVTSYHMNETDKLNWEVYTANTDGTGIKRITTNKSYDFWPSISPDGKTVAFQGRREKENSLQIYAVGEDGVERQLTVAY